MLDTSDAIPEIVKKLAAKVGLTPMAWRVEPTFVNIVFTDGRKMVFERKPPPDKLKLTRAQIARAGVQPASGIPEPGGSGTAAVLAADAGRVAPKGRIETPRKSRGTEQG